MTVGIKQRPRLESRFTFLLPHAVGQRRLRLAISLGSLAPRGRKLVLALVPWVLGFRPWPAHNLVDSPMCLWTLRVRTAPPFGFLLTQGRLECGNLRCDASEARVAPQPSLVSSPSVSIPLDSDARPFASSPKLPVPPPCFSKNKRSSWMFQILGT